MKPAFDLLKSPWVPCIRADGRIVELSLRDALAQAHELRELHGESPLVTAALHRLLLAVLHRVFGPPTTGKWTALWAAGRWDVAQVDTYLNRWRHRFDLFHAERPFYQAADDRVRPKSVASLVHDVASGNNPTLFDHHTEEVGITLTPAQAARMVVAAQAFGLGGLSGLAQKFTDAPCASCVIFLVQGGTLFETLALNLVRHPDPAYTPIPHQPDDCPAWEMDDPFTPSRSTPCGYLDYLTWQNRRILLVPEEAENGLVVREMTMAPALRLEREVLEPMAHYRRDERLGPRPLAFREGRALWRDSAALFRLREGGYQPPRAFRWLAELVEDDCLERTQTRRYLALGMSKKQAKVHFYRSERMPLPLSYLTEPELVEALEAALTMAESAARQLWGAVRTLATLVLSPESDTESARQPAREDLDTLTQQWAIERRYWPRLEIPFRRAMETLPEGPEAALGSWRKTLWRTTWSSFDQITGGLSHAPCVLKAVVRGRDQLAAGLAKTLPDL